MPRQRRARSAQPTPPEITISKAEQAWQLCSTVAERIVSAHTIFLNAAIMQPDRATPEDLTRTLQFGVQQGWLAPLFHNGSFHGIECYQIAQDVNNLALHQTDKGWVVEEAFSTFQLPSDRANVHPNDFGYYLSVARQLDDLVQRTNVTSIINIT